MLVRSSFSFGRAFIMGHASQPQFEVQTQLLGAGLAYRIQTYIEKHRKRPASAHRDRSTRGRVTMRSSSALLIAVLGAVCSWNNASAFFASSAGAARPRGFLPGWALPRHESALDRVSDVRVDFSVFCLVFRVKYFWQR